jgi:hypothetical protein
MLCEARFRHRGPRRVARGNAGADAIGRRATDACPRGIDRPTIHRAAAGRGRLLRRAGGLSARLLAAHCYTLRARGVGGSAHARQSISHVEVVEDIADLGTALSWHGALHVEYFADPAANRRQYLEANPRIGETMNATLSGVNLCEVLVQVSRGQALEPLPPSRPGVRTHSLMMSLLGAAERGADRRALVAEILRAWRREGVYCDSHEELTRWDEDPLSLIPLLAVAGRLLARPQAADAVIRRAVDHYSLDEEAIRRILALPADLWQDGVRPIPDRGGILL